MWKKQFDSRNPCTKLTYRNIKTYYKHECAAGENLEVFPFLVIGETSKCCQFRSEIGTC